MRQFSLLINGKDTTTANVLEVRNPFDDTLVGTTYLAGTAELETHRPANAPWPNCQAM
jgi:hypothetical protein